MTAKIQAQLDRAACELAMNEILRALDVRSKTLAELEKAKEYHHYACMACEEIMARLQEALEQFGRISLDSYRGGDSD